MSAVPGERRMLLGVAVAAAVGLGLLGTAVAAASRPTSGTVTGGPTNAAIIGVTVTWLSLAAYGGWLRWTVRARMAGLLAHRLPPGGEQ